LSPGKGTGQANSGGHGLCAGIREPQKLNAGK
jgi:hypothetical protein